MVYASSQKNNGNQVVGKHAAADVALSLQDLNIRFVARSPKEYPMKTIRLLAGLVLASCASPAPVPMYDAMPAIGLDAGQCVSCVQSDVSACGGRPSACLCYPGPACCCQKVGP